MDLVSVARGGTGEENPRPRPCAGAATWLTGDRLHFAYEQRAFVDRGSSRRLMTVRWSALLSEPRPADIRLSQPSRTPQATVHQAPSPIRHEGGVVVGVTDQLHHLDSRSFHIRAGACPLPPALAQVCPSWLIPEIKFHLRNPVAPPQICEVGHTRVTQALLPVLVVRHGKQPRFSEASAGPDQRERTRGHAELRFPDCGVRRDLRRRD